jgi:hypothetical protein
MSLQSRGNVMKRFFFASLGLLAAVACKPATKEPVDVGGPSSSSPSAPSPSNAVSAAPSPNAVLLSPAQKLTAQGGEARGVLTKLEDAGYPMFIASITLPDGGVVEALFNNEAVAVAGEANSLVGKPVTASISITSQASLLRLAAKGQTVYEFQGDGALEIPADAKTVTGTLSGADTPSGDLPSQLKITSTDGSVVDFEEFSDPKLEAQNGKVVTMTYIMRDSADVIALSADTSGAAKSK